MYKTLLSLVALCAACGSNFTATGGGGGDGGRESIGGGASAGAGTGGSAEGGASSGASAGGASAGSGATSQGGALAGGGGDAMGGGAGGSADCATLIDDYQAAIEKARVCTKGSTNQCNVMSTLGRIGCGCSVLVNSKSPYTEIAQQKQAAIEAGHCNTGPVCAIQCVAIKGAECTSQSMSSGNVFLCTATN